MIRVAKVGGSLLTWNELPSKLNAWLEQAPQASTVMISGGGPWAELLRQSAKRFDIAESSAHAMCVQAMSVTASLLADLCKCPLARSIAELRQMIPSESKIVFDVQQWLGSDSLSDLPKTWDVTSDSIAARLTVELLADELLLFKSRSAASNNLRELANSDYVDRYFPTAAADIRAIRYQCLRD